MSNYQAPPDVEVEKLKRQAQRRRKALTAAGCSTYSLGFRPPSNLLGMGAAPIVCLCCGLGSVNPSDITERYCGFCHEFHVEEREP